MSAVGWLVDAVSAHTGALTLVLLAWMWGWLTLRRGR